MGNKTIRIHSNKNHHAGGAESEFDGIIQIVEKNIYITNLSRNSDASMFVISESFELPLG
ncbi:MAG: hypothetical protein IJ086_10725 [Clostridium sp.]|nr:hypothetical protein [Clostridium sp.]